MEIEGLDTLREALKQASEEVRRGAVLAVRESLKRVHRSMVYKIQQEAKTGKYVFSYNQRIMHRQSAPYEPPASDTGRLVGSLYWETFGMYGYVGATAEYATRLEKGDKGMRLLPRPFLKPSLQEDAEQFLSDLEEVLK